MIDNGKSIVNPLNGKPGTRFVFKTDELYNGPFRSHLLDVVIGWDPEARITTDPLTDNYRVIHVVSPSCPLSPFYMGIIGRTRLP